MPINDFVLRRPSHEWQVITGITVRDPDGWDRTNFRASWAEAITLEEFHNRAAMSTVEALVETPAKVNTVSKSLLIERIETKIEEYRESGDQWGDVILGLHIALNIINQ